MKNSTALFFAKINVSLRAAGRVLARPAYALLAGVFAFLFFQIVYWAFNYSILSVVLGSGIGLGDKVVFLLSPFTDIFTTTSGFVGTLMLLVALIQGINLSLLTYTIKHQRRLNAGVIGGGSVAGLLAVFGLGCSACGTSLLVPIVAIFASASAVAVAETVTIAAPLLAVIVGLIGVYYLGIQVATIDARLKQADHKTEAIRA